MIDKEPVFNCLRIYFIGIIGMLLTACASSPRNEYYTLGMPAASDTGVQNKLSNPSYKIAIGSVTIPEMVDRPQLVLQTNSNQVTILESHRWAQPLKSEISRAIAASLSQQLDNAWVTDSLNAGRDIEYRVSIDVRRFESKLGEKATVDVLWAVRQMAGDKILMGKSTVNEPVNGIGYDALATAHARALVSISSDIADAVRSFTSKPQNQKNRL